MTIQPFWNTSLAGDSSVFTKQQRNGILHCHSPQGITPCMAVKPIEASAFT